MYKRIENTMTQEKEKHKIRILALDNATHITGYAIFEDGKYIGGGIKKAKSSASTLERIIEIKEWMLYMIKEWNIDYIGLEDVFFHPKANAQTLIILSKLLGVLETVAYETLNTLPFVIPAVTWKSHSNVKGRTRVEQKRNAQKIVKIQYGIDASQDLSDAILLGRYVTHLLRFGKEVKWGD